MSNYVYNRANKREICRRFAYSVEKEASHAKVEGRVLQKIFNRTHSPYVKGGSNFVGFIREWLKEVLVCS